MDGFPYRNRCKSPFLSVFFLKSGPYVHRPARKRGCQKKRTDRQQTKVFWPISSSAGTRFWTAKCPIPLAKPLKSGSQNGSRISLKTLLKGTSGFSSVVGTLLKLRLRRNRIASNCCKRLERTSRLNHWRSRRTSVSLRRDVWSVCFGGVR